jgi:hypothetical protein
MAATKESTSELRVEMNLKRTGRAALPATPLRLSCCMGVSE